MAYGPRDTVVAPLPLCFSPGVRPKPTHHGKVGSRRVLMSNTILGVFEKKVPIFFCHGSNDAPLSCEARCSVSPRQTCTFVKYKHTLLFHALNRFRARKASFSFHHHIVLVIAVMFGQPTCCQYTKTCYIHATALDRLS